MLIAEDLLLLLLDDESGRPAKASHLPVALGGALLVDLVLAEAVRLEPKQGLLGSATVRTTGTAVEDPMLGGALAVVEEKARSPKALVERLGKGSKERVAERLADRGLVEKHEGKVLGLFPSTTWPAADASYEQSLRSTLTTALGTGHVADPRTGALIALLSAIDHAPKVVTDPSLSNREVRQRAKQIAEGEWAAKAVKDSIDAAMAATVAAISAATAASVSAGSS